MKIFLNKIPKTWKSSGVIQKGSQMEMSNFSFAEDYFKSKEFNIKITIIGKNIIGNGHFIFSVFKNEFLVWQEDLFFKNISFSKKTIEIEEEIDKDFRIVISRGRKSKGSILIDSVSVHQEKNVLNIIEKKEDIYNKSEDEPTFFIDYKEISLKKEEIVKEEELIIKEEVVTSDPIVEPKIKKISAVRKKPVLKKQKKEKKKIEDEPAEEASAIEALPVTEEVVAPHRNNISVIIFDFTTINDEREIFKYINQISFGKDKHLFLIKKNESIEFDSDKYSCVKMFEEDEDLRSIVSEINPNKITFDSKSLGKNLSEIAKNLMDNI